MSTQEKVFAPGLSFENLFSPENIPDQINVDLIGFVSETFGAEQIYVTRHQDLLDDYNATEEQLDEFFGKICEKWNITISHGDFKGDVTLRAVARRIRCKLEEKERTPSLPKKSGWTIWFR